MLLCCRIRALREVRGTKNRRRAERGKEEDVKGRKEGRTRSQLRFSRLPRARRVSTGHQRTGEWRNGLTRVLVIVTRSLSLSRNDSSSRLSHRFRKGSLHSIVVRETRLELDDSSNEGGFRVKSREFEIGDPVGRESGEKRRDTSQFGPEARERTTRRRERKRREERKTHQSFQSHWNPKLLKC